MPERAGVMVGEEASLALNWTCASHLTRSVLEPREIHARGTAVRLFGVVEAVVVEAVVVETDCFCGDHDHAVITSFRVREVRSGRDDSAVFSIPECRGLLHA